MSTKPREVDGMWQKLGFEITNGDHVFAAKMMGGQIICRTKRSHGSGEISRFIIDLIRKQMLLNKRDFALALACPLTRQQYETILINDGHFQNNGSSQAGESPQ